LYCGTSRTYLTIDQKTLLWETWLERGIDFVQDLSSSEGRFLSLEEFHEKSKFDLVIGRDQAEHD